MTRTTGQEPSSLDIHSLLQRIEAKLDQMLGAPAPAPAPVKPVSDEIRGLLAQLDAVRSQVARAFDQVQAELAELVACDAEQAQ